MNNLLTQTLLTAVVALLVYLGFTAVQGQIEVDMEIFEIDGCDPEINPYSMRAWANLQVPIYFSEPSVLDENELAVFDITSPGSGSAKIIDHTGHLILDSSNWVPILTNNETLRIALYRYDEAGKDLMNAEITWTDNANMDQEKTWEGLPLRGSFDPEGPVEFPTMRETHVSTPSGRKEAVQVTIKSKGVKTGFLIFEN